MLILYFNFHLYTYLFIRFTKQMNVLKLEQREEVIALIEKQLMEQHALAKESIEPVSLSFT